MGELVYAQLSRYFFSKQVIFGITDTKYSSFTDDYSHALIYGVPHRIFLDLSSYRESLLEEVINQCKNDIQEIERFVEGVFCANKIEYTKPPVAQDNEIDFKGEVLV